MRGLSRRKQIGLYLGPVFFFLVLLAPRPSGMPAEAQAVAAVAALMAVWWVSEAIPIPATALLPIALFPALDVMPSSEVTLSYANHLIYLYLGGFLIAVTMQKWDLHRRIALLTILLVGLTPRRIVLGFMLATAFLSMWISNTATTMMMMPIGLAVIGQAARMMREKDPDRIGEFEPGAFGFGTSLMLGIAYSASVGGVATLIGTPPNAILAGVVENTYGQVIPFSRWMAFGLPVSAVMLTIIWLYLTYIACPASISTLPGGRTLIQQQLEKLGPIRPEEKRVLIVFITVALAWICRGLLPWEILGRFHDSTIAVAGALALFLIPAPSREGRFLLDWKTAVSLPWDIIILFGGGFALASGFSESGLTHWIAGSLTSLEGSSMILLIGVVALTVIFLTEVTSNTATASLLLPVIAAFAEAMEVHPYGFMITVTVAASFAFMMPVATPPNAIVFSSRYVTIPQMAKVGFWLNLIGCLVLVLFILFWLPLVWGIQL